VEDIGQQVAADLAQLRLVIGEAVRPHINQFAAIIGLQTASSQFEGDIIEALLWCVVTYHDAPNRKRYSDIRKELLRVSREARTAERSLDRLRNALNELTPRHREFLAERLEPVARVAVSLVAKQAPWFHALALVGTEASFYAEELKTADKGGAPKMLAWGTLVSLLKRAFERATESKTKVIWNPIEEEYQGPFVGLVEAVLPLTESLTGNEKRTAWYPQSPQARGKSIQRMTYPSGAGKKKR
jgi:hypothetical protein